jgi:hypothetical protein
MKKVLYFSHDADARRDPKMAALIARTGMEGYGQFWVIIEILREQDAFRLPCKSWAFEALGAEMRITPGEAQTFVETLCKSFDLLRTDGKAFWSDSLDRRMALMTEKSEQARKAAEKRWAGK